MSACVENSWTGLGEHWWLAASNCLTPRLANGLPRDVARRAMTRFLPRRRHRKGPPIRKAKLDGAIRRKNRGRIPARKTGRVSVCSKIYCWCLKAALVWIPALVLKPRWSSSGCSSASTHTDHGALFPFSLLSTPIWTIISSRKGER